MIPVMRVRYVFIKKDILSDSLWYDKTEWHVVAVEAVACLGSLRSSYTEGTKLGTK